MRHMARDQGLGQNRYSLAGTQHFLTSLGALKPTARDPRWPLLVQTSLGELFLPTRQGLGRQAPGAVAKAAPREARTLRGVPGTHQPLRVPRC